MFVSKGSDGALEPLSELCAKVDCMEVCTLGIVT